MNVTETAATTSGYLTVFPAGQALPTASSLNFVAGRSVPNEVIVPVTDGKVQIYNGSLGTVHILADLAGFFGSAQSGATQQFVPYAPTRVLDTRTQVPTSPLLPNRTLQFDGVRSSICSPVCQVATAYVFNVTVTQPMPRAIWQCSRP